ncbi:type 1 periplasmic binding fold superfamily protein [Flavobacterium salilacus subsp. salilacus]|uniref:type 1 periplasmic binding fold superfamily protein n=1 Tax=Flavobacterium TaxID=237 RepID=UPI0010752DE5|nr:MULTISPECIES: type 1 periplasmic binding fold superfamily protein [Flavobacterium]KAF2514498.1 type 1 periplasmic binding fold superfamily protein [Flavobacterium salilacus subsp. salilacus]MBE1615927.1 type 1 periplasmic binding fold superfamily protein [Flavobacterium sp. SaA2.13]
MKQLKLSALALLTFISLTSCSNDDDAPFVNEEEVITTITATFTPVADGETVILTSRDLDGDGPDAPVLTVSGDFIAGANYTGSVTFLNETESPAENITEEVQEEGDEHQIFYQANGLGTFAYTDQDVNGDPIGLAFTFEAAETATTGNLTVTLRHEPNKDAEGVASGNITNAGGSTDATATFQVAVVVP